MLNRIKTKVSKMGTQVGILTTAMLLAFNNAVYAQDDMAGVLSSNLKNIANKAIAALATIVAVAALIKGAMSIYDMAQGSSSNNPEQQDKGQKSLVSSIGMAVAAGALLGIRTIIGTFIDAAMK